MLRTILVPLAQGLSAQPALEAAFGLAKRMEAHLSVMFVRPNPTAVLPYLPLQFGGSQLMHDEVEREDWCSAGLDRSRFEGWRVRHEIQEAPVDDRLDSCFASWTERVGEIEPIVTRYGRVSDLIVMSRFQLDDVAAERCFDAAVFGSGRPTLLVPEQPAGDLLDHVIVAWNGSLEVSHAVFGAMPLLRAAGRVSIFSVAERGNAEAEIAPLAEALSWHGVPTHAVPRSAVPRPTGAALLADAALGGVSLIVMGAYTHSRLWQEVLGDVTRQVLAESNIPVLMSH
jgi:nucleotide-binding universal stress UspA family protein